MWPTWCTPPAWFLSGSEALSRSSRAPLLSTGDFPEFCAPLMSPLLGGQLTGSHFSHLLSLPRVPSAPCAVRRPRPFCLCLCSLPVGSFSGHWPYLFSHLPCFLTTSSRLPSSDFLGSTETLFTPPPQLPPPTPKVLSSTSHTPRSSCSDPGPPEGPHCQSMCPPWLCLSRCVCVCVLGGGGWE